MILVVSNWIEEARHRPPEFLRFGEKSPQHVFVRDPPRESETEGASNPIVIYRRAMNRRSTNSIIRRFGESPAIVVRFIRSRNAPPVSRE